MGKKRTATTPAASAPPGDDGKLWLGAFDNLLDVKAAMDTAVERAVRSRIEQRMRDHIRGHPEFTAEKIARCWAAVAIANAAEGSRGN
jgi:hypothetical protein